MKLNYVYILKCSDGTYYTGVTSELEKRIEKHHSGFYVGSYTSKRRPLELVYYCKFTDINLGIQREKQIKKWSKAKKEALIEGRYEDLPNLARPKGFPTRS